MMQPLAARGVRGPSLAAAALSLLLSSPAPAQSAGSRSQPEWSSQPQLSDRLGTAIHQDPAGQSGSWNRVEALAIPHQPERPASATVSLGRLRHKVPGRARREFDKALVCSRQGDSQAAVVHFEKAIEIDPAYLEAYNNLGVRQTLQIGRPHV